MFWWLILLTVLLSGCSGSHTNSVAPVNPDKQVVAHIAIPAGIAQLGSATASVSLSYADSGLVVGSGKNVSQQSYHVALIDSSNCQSKLSITPKQQTIRVGAIASFQLLASNQACAHLLSAVVANRTIGKSKSVTVVSPHTLVPRASVNFFSDGKPMTKFLLKQGKSYPVSIKNTSHNPLFDVFPVVPQGVTIGSDQCGTQQSPIILNPGQSCTMTLTIKGSTYPTHYYLAVDASNLLPGQGLLPLIILPNSYLYYISTDNQITRCEINNQASLGSCHQGFVMRQPHFKYIQSYGVLQIANISGQKYLYISSHNSQHNLGYLSYCPVSNKAFIESPCKQMGVSFLYVQPMIYSANLNGEYYLFNANGNGSRHPALVERRFNIASGKLESVAQLGDMFNLSNYPLTVISENNSDWLISASTDTNQLTYARLIDHPIKKIPPEYCASSGKSCYQSAHPKGIRRFLFVKSVSINGKKYTYFAAEKSTGYTGIYSCPDTEFIDSADQPTFEHCSFQHFADLGRGAAIYRINAEQAYIYLTKKNQITLQACPLNSSNGTIDSAQCQSIAVPNGKYQMQLGGYLAVG